MIMTLILLVVYLITVLFRDGKIDCNILMLRDTVLCDFQNDVYLLIRNIIELQKYNAIMQKGKNTCQMPVIFVDYILLTSGKKRIGKTKIILFSAECIFLWKTYLTNLLAHII